MLWSRRALLVYTFALEIGLAVGLATGAPAQVAPTALAAPADAASTLAQPVTGRALPCEQGAIQRFPCRNVELLSYLPAATIGGGGIYDLWGWTDSVTGREFVLTAGDAGTAFVEVTDPVHPKYLGWLPLHGGATQGIPGVKVYQHYAFIVAEIAFGQGMQVFDLTQLRDVTHAPVTFTETAHYNQLGNAHTLTLDPQTGFAFAAGSFMGGETCGSGLHMIDVRTPTQPTFAGCYTDVEQGAPTPGYVHDAQCVVYHGPDTRYTGRELCVYASGTAVGVVDVTDKQHPTRLGMLAYPDVGYTHQGWFTEDQRYFILDDEGLNKGTTDQYPTMVLDMRRLDDLVVATRFPASTPSMDHNLYIRGRYLYQAAYKAGLRIVDVQDPTKPHEIGSLVTVPQGDAGAVVAGGSALGSLGAWSTYPFLTNDVVAVASGGLFLVRLRSR